MLILCLFFLYFLRVQITKMSTTDYYRKGLRAQFHFKFAPQQPKLRTELE